MAQIALLESQVDINSSAEMYYKTFCTKQNIIPKICPNLVKDVQLVTGDGDSLGSVKKWTFVPSDESRPEAGLFQTVAMDQKNKSITFEVIDGEVKKLYSMYRFTVQVTGKGNNNKGNCSTVKIIVQYEKQNANVPEPAAYLEFGMLLHKTLDAYLVKNKE